MNPKLILLAYSHRDSLKYLILLFFITIFVLPILTFMAISSDPKGFLEAVGKSIVYKAFGFYDPEANEFVEYRGKFVWPMNNIVKITQEYKEIDITQRIFHTGIDMVGKYRKKEEVLAAYTGRVIEAGDTFLSQGYANH